METPPQSTSTNHTPLTPLQPVCVSMMMVNLTQKGKEGHLRFGGSFQENLTNM